MNGALTAVLALAFAASRSAGAPMVPGQPAPPARRLPPVERGTATAGAAALPPLPPIPGVTLAQVATRAQRWLEGAANEDGGFGYNRPGDSFTAPTALAALAMQTGTARRRALDWLRQTQLPGGGWPVGAGDPDASWMTSVAMVALAREAGERPRLDRAAAWLLETAVAYREPSKPAAGWPWTPGTAPWIEPTAWALLGLSASKGAAISPRPRFREAIAYVASEVNREGGWSLYEARPFPYHTALVLLALERLPEGDGGIGETADGREKARRFLANALSASSPHLDLGWGLWALTAGEADMDVVARVSGWLAARQRSDGSFGGSPWATAAALAAFGAVHGRDPLGGGAGAR